MKRIWVAACIVLCAMPALAQPPAPQIKMLQDEPVSDDASKHAVTATADWPPGATTGLHTHPGDEYATVLEGAVEVTTEGKGAHIYKAGEAYHNARGVVHETRTAGEAPARTVAVFIIDKGAPLSQPVK
jgi:quercetin dioxygenase-like cupin family protein